MKKKAYLLIDIAVGSAVISIFTLVIFSMFQGYINLRKKRDNNEFIYFIVQELENNTDYNSLNKFESGEYYINLKDKEEVKNKNIIQCIGKEKSGNSNRLIINKEDGYIECDLQFNNYKDEVGFIKYRGIL